MTVLDWYAKPNGPGDLDAAGSRRLLGVPSVKFPDLLLRETAQNSWDARVASTTRVPTYGVRVRELSPEVLELMRTRVIVGQPESLGLAPELGGERALEIYDRGTKGLGGPIRNDLSIPPGSPRDFVDFVLNVGAPRDNSHGGGTYGFGKTAAYAASRRGVVIIWTRTAHGEALEDRLIVSAMGASFDLDSRVYTGRHWWGVMGSDDRVEPLIGLEAASLGHQLFERGFEEHETGTSLLVLDPDPEKGLGDPELDRSTNLDESEIESIGKIFAVSAVTNLWPKLLPEQSTSRTMKVEIAAYGVAENVEPSNPVWVAYGDCLRAVRAAQSGRDEPPLFGQVVEIRSHAPSKLIGHLALAKRLRDPDQDQPEHHVCLMRHEAELVVKYWSLATLDDSMFDWVGVFKPTSEMDSLFAEAEPPSHDDWVVPTRTGRSFVRIALTRIEEAVRAFLNPAPVARSSHELRSTAPLADALADLAGGGPGGRAVPEADTTPPSSGRSGSRSTTRVAIVAHRVERRPGVQNVEVDFDIQTAEDVEVVPVVKVASEGGSDADEDVRVVGWEVDGSFRTAEALAVQRDCMATLRVSCPPGLALDIRHRVVKGAA